MKLNWNRAARRMLPAAMLIIAANFVFAEGVPVMPASLNTNASPLTQLAWEADYKETTTKLNDAVANFQFAFTNISDQEVVIDHVTATCSCTVAKLPSEPWHLPAHTNDHLNVTVDLKGKAGEFEKRVTVFYVDKSVPPKTFTLKVKMPDRKMMRDQNNELAKADRQAVFKGDCAKCHAEPAKHGEGMVLYHDICGICHEARPRATMVPDLRLVPHPTDYAFWKELITNGKPGTLMPAFAQSQGGPLTDQQIDTLAKAIDNAYPYSRFGGKPPQPEIPTITAEQVGKPNPSTPKN